MQSKAAGGSLGYRLIGALKLCSALLLVCAGLGIFRLLNRDLGEALEHFATRLHLDPENRLIQSAAAQIGGINQAQLKAIAAGTFFYATLEGLEGVGLLLRRRWAEYLTVVATALLLPLEIYEIARKPTALRYVILASNLAILFYLIWRLWKDHKGEPASLSGTA